MATKAKKEILNSSQLAAKAGIVPSTVSRDILSGRLPPPKLKKGLNGHRIQGFDAENQDIKNYISLRKKKKRPPKKWESESKATKGARQKSIRNLEKRGMPLKDAKKKEVAPLGEVEQNPAVEEMELLLVAKKKADIRLVERRIKAEDRKHDKEIGALLPVDFFIPLLSRITKEAFGFAKDACVEIIEGLYECEKLTVKERKNWNKLLIERMNEKDTLLRDAALRETEIIITDYLKELQVSKK